LTVKTEQFLVDDSFTRRHSMMRRGPAVRVIIEDNGPGMSAAILERAFEPFFTTKAPGEGSGLGLSIVHGIVTKHAGVVVATSRPGEGARFEIYLPSQGELAAPLPDAALEPARDPSAKKLRILCVDDEPAVLRVVSQVLQQEGHDVTAIASSREALQTLSTHPSRLRSRHHGSWVSILTHDAAPFPFGQACGEARASPRVEWLSCQLAQRVL
jgi:NAD(P)-dependent dehydrogenase (short-subunit alcohol dehydrogenase family)